MSAAAKPATPLPWIDPRTISAPFSIWKGDIQVAACRVVDETGATVPYMVDHDGACAQNAAYIVAACNAYPELVAALRNVRGYSQEAAALLAKLGEQQ